MWSNAKLWRIKYWYAIPTSNNLSTCIANGVVFMFPVMKVQCYQDLFEKNVTPHAMTTIIYNDQYGSWPILT